MDSQASASGHDVTIPCQSMQGVGQRVPESLHLGSVVPRRRASHLTS